MAAKVTSIMIKKKAASRIRLQMFSIFNVKYEIIRLKYNFNGAKHRFFVSVSAMQPFF